MLRVLSLFAGIGGFDLGLERAGGFKTVAFCEIDDHASAVLARHWPDVPNLGDVTKAEFPDADIIVGGFPCQDVSRAGKRAGVSGARSGLYRELVRAIRVVRPRYAILENVAALLSNGMGTVLGDLAEVGDCIEWDIVPACAIGAPHERERVWIVAHDNERREPSGRSQPIRWGIAGQEEGEGAIPDATGIGRGQGRTGRPPDSFAWIRDATRWHAANANGTRYAVGEGERCDARQEQPAAQRSAFENVWEQGWTCESALLGVDDGIPDRVERTRALGNSLLPQIPELIGRAILQGAIRRIPHDPGAVSRNSAGRCQRAVPR